MTSSQRVGDHEGEDKEKTEKVFCACIGYAYWGVADGGGVGGEL